jgi:hypothetical protein
MEGKPEALGEKSAPASSSIANYIWTALELKPGLRGTKQDSTRPVLSF